MIKAALSPPAGAAGGKAGANRDHIIWILYQSDSLGHSIHMPRKTAHAVIQQLLDTGKITARHFYGSQWLYVAQEHDASQSPKATPSRGRVRASYLTRADLDEILYQEAIGSRFRKPKKVMSTTK